MSFTHTECNKIVHVQVKVETNFTVTVTVISTHNAHTLKNCGLFQPKFGLKMLIKKCRVES